jgi:GNAT superfamily N-acetyltransferase
MAKPRYTFTLRQATPADVPAMADAFGSAFVDDFIGRRVFFAPELSNGGREFWEGLLGEEIQDSFARFLICETDAPATTTRTTSTNSASGTLNSASDGQPNGTTNGHANGAGEPSKTFVGFSKWVAPGAPYQPWPTRDVFPQKGDLDLAVAFFTSLSEKHETIMADRPHWYLELIAVRSEWQRKGAGALLMGWGCARADADGVEAYLDATEAGLRMYEAFGFVSKEVEGFMDGKERHAYMVRPKKYMTMNEGNGVDGAGIAKIAETVSTTEEPVL